MWQITESSSGEISSGEKSPGKYFWQFCQISEIFSDRGTFRKISGKISLNFNNKSIIYRLYTRVCTLLYPCCPKCFRKLPGNFSESFLSCDQLVTTELIRMLHIQKVQIHDCKHVFYFNKGQKVSLGKFPPEENSPKNISNNFVKFRKFFSDGRHFGKFRGKRRNILLIKSIIYRLYTSTCILYTDVVLNVSGNLRETFQKLFCPVTNLSHQNL